MVGVGVVDTFSAVDGRASCAAWSIAIALDRDIGCQHARCDSGRRRFAPEGIQTLDFLLRHAMHAVLTHRRLAEAADSLSRSFRPGLGVLEGDRDSTELSMLSGMEGAETGSCGCSPSAIGSVKPWVGSRSPAEMLEGDG